MINPFKGNTWVAYFDIMGFRHFMDTDKGLNVLNKFLDDAYHTLDPSVREASPQNIDGIFFSDSGVIFYPQKLSTDDRSNFLNGLNEILRCIRELNKKFITPSPDWGGVTFLTKSAVAFGEFIYEKKEEHIHISKGPVYGRGYVKACQSIEGKLPHQMEIGEVRIILDDSLSDIIEEEKQNNAYPEFKHLYQISRDHCYYSWTHHFQPNSDLNRTRTYDYNYDFPTTDGAINETSNGEYDVFVCKLSADAHTLEYSTVLGGDGFDFGRGIAVDAAGCAYITGYTGLESSKSFPTTTGAYDTSRNDWDAFLCKISDDGKTLLYSTFLGGNGADSGWGIALDGVGNVYISGHTQAGFPTTTGAYDTSYNGGSYDAFLCKMSADGSAMLNSTLIGGSSDDRCWNMAMDLAGCLYLTGTTTNTTANFPTTPGAYDRSNNGGSNDIFVCKLNADGSSLLYSTFIGGNGRDTSSGIAVDAAGCAHIQGTIYESAGVPTTSDAINTTAPGGTCDAYVFKLSADGSSLLYATYLGCTGEDNGYAITLDAANYVYITGGTANSTVFFPTTPDALNETHNGDVNDWDMYYSKLDLGPTTPSFITGSQTIKENNITVQWNAAAGATQYNIYVNGVLNETTDGPVTSQKIMLNRKGVYSLTVTAIRNGHESPQSVAITVTADITEDQNWTMAIIIVIVAGAIIIGGFMVRKVLKKRKK